MLTRTQRQLEGVRQKLEEHGLAAQAIIDSAAKEDRDRTSDEDAEIAEHQKEMGNLRIKRDELDGYLKTEQEVADLGRAIGVKFVEDEQAQNGGKSQKPTSPGEALIKSSGYLEAKAKGFSGRFTFSTGEIEGKTLLETDSLNDTDVIGGIIRPDVQAGVLGVLTQQPTVADLIGSSPTTSNVVSIIKQTLNTQAATVVPEGEGKPEAAFEFDTQSVDVDTVAHSLPVTNQFLEDAPALVTFVNGQLALGVRQREERYVLDELIAAVTGANADVTSSATAANDADHVYAGMTAIRLAFQEPTGIVVHPSNWESLRLTKDQNDNYIAGSPFSNTGSNPAENLWGKPVVVTQSIPEGLALVITSSAATLYRRSGLSVESSNSHSDFFVKNKTMIRAEERIAVGVWRPDGIATVDLLES